MYIVAMEFGSSSIGLAIRDGDGKLTHAATYKFSQGEQGERGAMRRSRLALRRHKAQRKSLQNLLAAHQMLPHFRKPRDPNRLRAEALDRPVTRGEFGAILLHLFKNRGPVLADLDEDSDGAIADAVNTTKAMMAGCRTIGEWRHKQKLGRIRPQLGTRTTIYPYFHDRQMIRDEFETLWRIVAPRLGLDDTTHDAFANAIFYQRPSMPPPCGKCSIFPTEPRARIDMPSFQLFRIVDQINNTRWTVDGITKSPLDGAQRQTLREALLAGDVTFNRARKMLGLPADSRLNYEAAGKQKFIGWESPQPYDEKAPLHEQDERFAVNGAAAGRPNYGSLSVDAVYAVLPRMLATGASFATVRAELFPNTKPRLLPTLPYIGVVMPEEMLGGTGRSTDSDEQRYGRLRAMRTHKALNVLRQVTNDILRHMKGRPARIVVQVSRDFKQTPEEARATIRQQLHNQQANTAREKWLREHNVTVTSENIDRLRLWEELNRDVAERRCIYTGELITDKPDDRFYLFGPNVETDFIVPKPYADGPAMDRGFGNQLLCVKVENLDKADKTPYEAFAHVRGYDYKKILERAKNLPRNKQWRFTAFARDRSAQQTARRYLVDTSYIASLAQRYLQHVSGNVMTVPWPVVLLLRRVYRLPEQQREDERRHASAAILLSRLTPTHLDQLHRAEHRGAVARRLFDETAVREEHDAWMDKVVTVWHREKNDNLRLHEEALYSLRNADDTRPTAAQVRTLLQQGVQRRMVVRKSIGDLTVPQIDRILDDKLRRQVQEATAGMTGKALQVALLDFAHREKMRHVRVGQNSSDKIVAYGERYYYPDDVYLVCATEHDGRWTFTGVNNHELQAFREHSSQGRRVLFHKDDMVRLTEMVDGASRNTVFRVAKFAPSKGNERIFLAPLHAAKGTIQIRSLSFKQLSRVLSDGSLRKVHPKVFDTLLTI